MAPIQTHIAHCGACSGNMMLQVDLQGWHFVCCVCGVETAPRPTIIEADDDVVWIPVTTQCGGGVTPPRRKP
jgi:hypothetical protein